MPVLRNYVDAPGYYVRGAIESEFITYQVSPAAARSLRKAGFDHGSTISWGLCSQLSAEGHLYTHGSGTNHEIESAEKPLGEREHDIVGGIESGEEEITVPKDVKSYLIDWCEGELSEAELQRLLADAGDSNWLISSVRSFAATQSPDDFDIVNGSPKYSYRTPIHWTIQDCRYQSWSSDFRIQLIGADEITVDIVVSNGALDGWSLDQKIATEEHVDLFLQVLPDIFDILDKLPGTKLDVGNWHFRNGREVKLTREQTQKIGEMLQKLANNYGLDEGPATGTILSKGYAGYRRVTVDGTRASIPFHYRDCTERGLREGGEVCYEIELIKYTFHAKKIAPLQSDED
jgi:hypothetical protein